MAVYERFYIKDVDWENFGVVDKVLNKLIAVTGSLRDVVALGSSTSVLRSVIKCIHMESL